MELEADLFGARDLEERDRPVAVECNLRVRGVMAQDDVVAPAEFDGTFEKLSVRCGGGRVVRIVEPHQPRPVRNVGGNRFEVGKPVIFRRERHHVWVGAGHDRAGHVDGVTRVGCEHDVARIDQGEWRVADPVFRAERGQDLGRRVELDA